VILDQSYSAKAVLAPEPFFPLDELPAAANNTDALKTQYLALYLAVLNHAALQAEVCARGLVAPALCGDRYLPRWLVAPARARVTAAALDRWSDEAQGAMLPLWDALCAKAIAKTGNKDFCAIE
jgi:hypothetical protein